MKANENQQTVLVEHGNGSKTAQIVPSDELQKQALKRKIASLPKGHPKLAMYRKKLKAYD